jgi:hypothetical protein
MDSVDRLLDGRVLVRGQPGELDHLRRLPDHEDDLEPAARRVVADQVRLLVERRGALIAV